MTDAAAAAPGPRPRSPVAAGWGTAARRGLLAFGALLLVAETVALAARAVGGGGASVLTTLRVGGLYLAAFHRVPLRLSGSQLDVSALTAGRAWSGSVSVELAFAPLLVTVVALWLLFRGGRAVAERVGGGPLARALHGAKVAPSYAAAVLAVCLLSPIRGPFPIGSLVGGSVELTAVPAWGLLLPLGLAAAAGAAGGWWSGALGQRVRATVEAGVWMLVLGLGLSYAGLLAAGAVRPDGPEALLTPTTGRYFRAVYGPMAVGTLVVAHHVAVAPNEAVAVLVPSMGGCTGAYGLEDGPERFVCYRRFPSALGLPAVVGGSQGSAGPVSRTRFGVAPAPYFLFLLVPAAATLLGGRRVVQALRPTSFRAAAGAAALAGVVFGVLVVVVAWFGSISAAGSIRLGDVLDTSGSVRVGPGLVGAALIAPAWGIAGGVAGAWLTARRDRSSRPTSGSGPRPR